MAHEVNNYDRINVPRFIKGIRSGYLCSMCGQYTDLRGSISSQGYNLICCRCEMKMRHLLDTEDIIKMIHKAGEDKRNEYKDIFKEGGSEDGH